MSQVPYIVAGWGVSGAAIAAYAAWVIRRGRRLATQVPSEERRWS